MDFTNSRRIITIMLFEVWLLGLLQKKESHNLLSSNKLSTQSRKLSGQLVTTWGMVLLVNCFHVCSVKYMLLIGKCGTDQDFFKAGVTTYTQLALMCCNAKLVCSFKIRQVAFWMVDGFYLVRITVLISYQAEDDGESLSS